MRILGTALIVALWLCGRIAAAADFDMVPATADARAFIVLSGDITTGDADRLAVLLDQHDDTIVFLHSDGGLAREAPCMGMMQREHEAAGRGIRSGQRSA